MQMGVHDHDDNIPELSWIRARSQRYCMLNQLLVKDLVRLQHHMEKAQLGISVRGYYYLRRHHHRSSFAVGGLSGYQLTATAMASGC